MYVVSATRLPTWLAEWDAPAATVRPLPIHEVLPGLVVEGVDEPPAGELLPEMDELHRRRTLGT